MMIEFYKPKVEEMWFKEKLLSDEETMFYNHAYGGTIPFPKEKWSAWHEHWVEKSGNLRFYRYIAENGEFVGEAAYHFDDAEKIFLADVIVYAPFRGRGFGKNALIKLCEEAERNGVRTLYDEIAIDNPSAEMYVKCGFQEVRRTGTTILLKKELHRYGSCKPSVTLGERTSDTVRIYFEKAKSPEIRRFLPQKAKTVEEALEDYQKTLLPHASSFGQTIYADGRYVGDVWCYCIDPHDEPNCMISYCIFDPEYRSKGVATAAVELFIKKICSMYPIKTIGAFTYSQNRASVRVLEKNGFSVIEEFEEDGVLSVYLEFRL